MTTQQIPSETNSRKVAKLKGAKRVNGEARALFWQVFVRVMSTIVLALLVAGIDLWVRVAQIESNRFTSRDAYEMERRLTDRFSRRPEWLSSEMAEIKSLLREFDAKFERHLEGHK